MLGSQYEASVISITDEAVSGQPQAILTLNSWPEGGPPESD